ncbi:YjbF family lipoprotein [Pseudidiomarina sp. 1ASP75-14]|uniref:YjbF family lipoprotein n=1 Tax=Pseudidiomarina terrestris TaxID=2820060 RepID=UPI00264B45CB|nr:YjbF family lipoprotein [Pseudidiomarina sp. 1ASP75-14]MDN7136794.1 YjbF family lipoprotein [Pseudidiomarina sp. 1ASP75-14]
MTITAMRGLVIATALIGLSGCSVFSSQESSQTTAATESLQFLFADTPEAPDLETLQRFPYPATYVQFADGPRTFLALAATGTHGQYWYSAGNEALTLWQGRAIRTSRLVGENRLHTTNLADDPLACYLHQAEQQNQQDTCAGSWQRSIQIQRPVANFNPHHPEYEIVTLQLSSSIKRNGRDLGEEGVATEYVAGEEQASYRFSNSYRLSLDEKYIISSRQWLTPAHGYVELEMVNLAQPNAPRGEPKITRFKLPVQTLNNGKAPRLRQFVEAVPQQFYPDSYWPGLRIHSQKLDERFAKRHAGMLKQLRMLAEIYRHDGNSNYANAAEQLIEQFQQWPLRASYVHGIDPAQMRVTLEQNPMLNTHDADNEYEVTLAAATSEQVGVGNLDAVKTERWLIQPNGDIRQLPKGQELSDGQPGIVLHSIAADELPPGFGTVNSQLAMFLQHWNYAAQAQAQAQQAQIQQGAQQ